MPSCGKEPFFFFKLLSVVDLCLLKCNKYELLENEINMKNKNEIKDINTSPQFLLLDSTGIK